MDVNHIQTINVSSPDSPENKDLWIKQHALQLQQLFQQWQADIKIDGEAYREYLESELGGYWEDPILKRLVESIGIT